MKNIFATDQESADDINQRAVSFSKAHSIIVSSNLVQQDKNIGPQNQHQNQNQRKSLESLTIEEQDIIYQEYLYDKFLLSPIEKYQKYGKWPIKLIVHVMLVLLTTSQILYSSNTLSTNSTEQYEQWRQLFFQEDSNQNIKNNVFENKMIYYTTVQKFQNQTILMFDEMNENNTNRIQDVYFNYSDISLKVYYNYPMDSHLTEYIHEIQDDNQNPQDQDQQTKLVQNSDSDEKNQKLDSDSDQNNLKDIPKMPRQRDFYQELNFNMNQNFQRRILNKTNSNHKSNLKNFNLQKYQQVQLVYPIDRKVGIQQPFDMNNITQIKQIFQFTNHLEIVMKNVILIKSNLISCWEFNIFYNLYGHATIQALLQADGGICTEELFQKGIELHKEEYFNSYAQPPTSNVDDNTQNSNQQNKQDEELLKKRQQMKVRGTRFNTLSSTSSQKKQKKPERSPINRKKTEQPKGQKINKQELLGIAVKPPDYERNGNLYKSGNLLFIGFNTLIDVMSFVCSAISLFLCLKYLIQIIDVYIQTFEKSTKAYIHKDLKKNQSLQKNKGKYLTLQRILAEQRGWNELSLWEKLSYFDLWFFVILIGNFFQMVGSIYLIFLDSQSELDQKTSVVNWTVGIGCFCAWCSLMKYLEHSKSMAIILDVLKFALPQLFKVLIEFSILYISFIIIGMTSFWQSERFSDVSSTAVTLFGVVLSDSIFYVAQDCEQNGVLPRFMADFYVILFVLMFIICVTNIMIGILEDGYSRNKMEQKFKKTIENVDNEKDRAVISKMVQKKELDRGSQMFRRQGSFDSDDGINYGKKNNANFFSPFQGANQSSPSFKVFTPQQKSLQVSPMIYSKSPKFSDKSKNSPLVQMKMVKNAGIAIQKAKRFVQIRKKEKQEQEKPKQAITFPNIQQQEEKDISMFDDQNLFFSVDNDQQVNQLETEQAFKQEQEQTGQRQQEVDFFEQKQQQDEEIPDQSSEQELEQQKQLSQRRKLKSKTLHNLNYQTIDEQDSSDSEKDEKKPSIQKIISSEDIQETQEKKTESDQFEKNNLSFSGPQTFATQTQQFFQALQVQKQLSASQVFKNELEMLKKKEVFVDKTNSLFNGGYKKIKFYLEESQKLVINTKFLQVTKQQKRYLYKKYSSYLQYFQQRIAANLLEIEYFQMD
ncbi:transmembrane protein, putative (macronuclear) [Tetrahymena thermophila SB210]|uniref:Transmembrane protein, putative n=1 Tax=Tetrahymena thermophila (strain SB210) TaxID=312017 RepID=Q23DW9_TETTS|nr:transmembrane protein, putative [Tetrahymena thermophila SB210]EAR94372.2 transmembrane protein, putative [Tetrahymena thermophila SB210]|eukprot:XP_001014567.2 transmembrane protein, putative [Tetrahymena thermophila SB210]